MAADQVRGAAADAVLGSGASKSFYNARMSSQAQVVVATKIQIVEPVHAHPWTLRGLQRQALPVEVLFAAMRESRA